MLRYLLSLLFGFSTFVTQPLTNDNGWRPAWGLDRIDQRDNTLDDNYTYNLTGVGVTVYVFDSGINSAHEEFGGRIADGYSVVNDSNGTEDCSGHGSHSASLIGGNTYGVAKKVRLIPVRVLNCSNSNPSSATLYPAFDWIIEHHQLGTPAVVNMSVGMLKSAAFNEATRRLIDDGLIVVGAAGNQSKDACLYSPASEPLVITVAGTDKTDLRGTQSNYGACVDVFAPGWDLVGAWAGASDNYRSSSGTSNAAPIVSGIAALMLEENPFMTQAEVKQRIIATATVDALFNIGEASPNLLAFTYLGAGTPATTTTTTTVTTTATTNTTTSSVPATTESPTTTNVPTTNSVTTTTVIGYVKTQNPVPLPSDLTCSRPAERATFFNVPYVCVNTGNQLMWIPQRYSPGRP